MTKDITLAKHANKLSGIATQLMSLMKDFDQEFKAFRKDAETKWQDKKNQMDYVVQELLAPVDDLIQANGENVYDYLNDAQEILRIESGFGPTNPVEDDFERASEEYARKQAELDQRIRVGLEIAASKQQITADLFNEDAAKESAKKQAELDRRRQAGLEFATSKKRITANPYE